MDQEQSWLTLNPGSEMDDETPVEESYRWFMKPEPRDGLSAIRTEWDPFLNREMRVRDMRIGMVRNAAEENKMDIQVYLDPFPHMRIDKAKPLQGWYKSLYEPPSVRNRPCMTDAVLTEPYGGTCSVNCGFSLPKGESIRTPFGDKSIERFKVGDLVWGRTKDGRVPVRVLGISHHIQPEGLVWVSLSDGRRLRMTGDHPMFSVKRGWVAADSLQYGEEIEDESMCRQLWYPGREQMVSGLLVGLQPASAKTPPKETLRYLRTTHSKFDAESLRSRFAYNQVQQWKDDEGQIQFQQRPTKIRGNETKDESMGYYSSRGYVAAGKRSENSGMEAGASRGCSQRYIGLPIIETSSLYRQKGSDIEIGLGSFGSQTFGRHQTKLGLRTIFDSTTGRLSISTGFCFETSRNNFGSERLFEPGRNEEDSTGSQVGLQSFGMRWKGNEKVRHPYVIGIERIPGAVEVFDIETESGNFYQMGILVHNCYVNAGTRGYRGSGLMTVPLNYGEQIHGQLRKMRRSAAGYFSSFTDVFNPLEEYYHNTEAAANEFVKLGLPIFFLSRLRYPDWAIRLLKKNKHSYAQKSINTSNPEDWKKLSPGALPLEDHFKDIARIKKHGIYVSIQVNPIIAGVTTHEDIYQLFKRLKQVGADHVIVKFVEASYSWVPAMVERMVKRFGERGREFERLFKENIGGQRTIEEDYRLSAHNRYRDWATKLGLTYATCYEYRKERTANGSIKSNTGISIGADFLTADQCHGHRVPIYSRETADEMFKPLDVCPPSGCLLCANAQDDGKPKCGDELMGEANALRLSDFKTPIGQGKARNPNNPALIGLENFE